jgi:hypothetical protein
LACALGAIAVLGLACTVDEPCDPDQELDELRFCVPKTPSAAGGADSGETPSGGAGLEAGSAGASACEAPSEFGDVCSASSDCRCEVDYCAIFPGETQGICTRTGCIDNPAICPDGWMCLDLSMFSAELPAICVPPE